MTRTWREPALLLGVLASIAAAVVTIATGDPWDTAAILAVVLPILEALGIRQLVTPDMRGQQLGEHEAELRAIGPDADPEA